MERYKEILIRALEREETRVRFPQLTIDPEKVVERRGCQALLEIREILDDLDEEECFLRIEKIVRVFEKLGSGGGGRHDFG